MGRDLEFLLGAERAAPPPSKQEARRLDARLERSLGVMLAAPPAVSPPVIGAPPTVGAAAPSSSLVWGLGTSAKPILAAVAATIFGVGTYALMDRVAPLVGPVYEARSTSSARVVPAPRVVSTPRLVSTRALPLAAGVQSRAEAPPAETAPRHLDGLRSRRSHEARGRRPRGADREFSATELRELVRARSLLSSDPDSALDLFVAHEAAYPRSRLAPEREVLIVDALRRLGRHAEARARADRFRRRHAGTTLEPALERALARRR